MFLFMENHSTSQLDSSFTYFIIKIAVIIGINITVAFIIDMYSSVERLDKERTQTLKLLEKEMEED